MRIAVNQQDGKFPNLALLQIAQYHILQGHSVEWFTPFNTSYYDKIYSSRIFNTTKRPLYLPMDTIEGGTGIDPSLKLPIEIEKIRPRFEAWKALYPNFERNLGFSQKGCRLACKFCVVPKKEGKNVRYSGIKDLMVKPSKDLVLMDNDFFGGPDWEDNMQYMIEHSIRPSFVQGLNIRLLTEEQAQYLAKVDFRNASHKKKQLTFAWDRPKDEKLIMRGFKRCVDAGIKPYKLQFFILIGFDTTFDQDMHRVQKIKDMGCDPFVMRMLERKYYASEFELKRARHFQRWVNGRLIKKISFKDYEPWKKMIKGEDNGSKFISSHACE